MNTNQAVVKYKIMSSRVKHISFYLLVVGFLATSTSAQKYSFQSSASNGPESTTTVYLVVEFDHPGNGVSYGVSYSLNADLTNASGGGIDYSFSTGSFSFFSVEVETLTQSIAITINNDLIDEYNEFLTINLNIGTNSPTLKEGGSATHTYTINDDDNPPEMQFSSTSSSTTEVAGSYNILVSLTRESGKDISVPYTVAAGTATAGDDYTLGDGIASITGALGLSSTNISFSVTHDVLDEFDETFQVTLGVPSNADQGTNLTHTVTILDNDPEPKVLFSGATGSGDESLDATVQFQLDAVSGRDVQVNFSIGGTADGGGVDYTTPSTTVTILKGQSSQDITIIVADDVNLDEDDETIILTLENAVYGDVAGSPTPVHTYTILDNDPLPTVQFNAGIQATQVETDPAANVTYTVDLSPASGRQVTVNYAVGAASTATSGGTDFSVGGTGTLTFAAGSTSETFTVTITDDTIDENDEDIIMELSSPSNASPGGIFSHTLTITDNDDPPTVGFSTSASSGNESTTPVNMVVELSEASGLDVSVYYSVTGGNALGAGPTADFTLAAGRDTIPGNQGLTSTTIPITIIDDSRYEAIDTIVVTLSSEVNGTLGSDTYTYVILNDDSAPTVTFAAPSSSGGESTDGSPTVELNLDAASDVDVTVDYTISGSSTATSGVADDFVLVAGPATISAGSTSEIVNFATVNNDALYENNETIILNLVNPSDAVLGAPSTQTHTYTILSEDPMPEVSVATSPASVSETAGSVQFTINLDAFSGLDVDVSYTLSGTANGGGEDYTLADDTATITAGTNSVNVTALLTDDNIYESDETLILTLSSPVNASLGNTSHSITITSDDVIPTIEFTFPSSNALESNTSPTIEVSLSTFSGLDASVLYSTIGGGTALGGGVDYTLTADTAVITAGQLTTDIAFTVVDDIYYESDETIILSISAPANADLGTNTSHTYFIDNNDLPPILQFSTISSSGNESVSPADLQIELIPPAQLPVSVDYTVTGGTATGGGVDYTLANNTLNIIAGDSLASISPLIADNIVVEPDETIVVTLTAGSETNASIGANDVHTYTILNDDFPPAAFTVGPVTVTGGTVITGYWNASNTGLDVTVPVEDDANLTGGTIQLIGIIGTDSSSVGAAYTIVLGDLGASVTIGPAAAQLEAITSFADGVNVEISAVITDAYGNSTTGTASANTVDIDQTAPAAFTVGQVNTTGGTIVTGYWNATNTGIDVVVPLANDATLEGGSVQLRAEADGAFENLGLPDTLQAIEVAAGSITISVSAIEVAATGVEELAGFTDGDVVTLNALITDVAGNNTTGTASDTTLVIDRAVPSAAVSYSDTLAKESDTITVTVTFDDDAAATPQIGLAYAINTIPATDMTATGDAAIWTHNVVVLAGNDGYVTISVTGTDAAGNALALDSLTNVAALLVDNTAPGYVLSYIDSLVKAAEVTTITARFTEPAQATPSISITFAGVGPNITSAAMLMAANDSSWTYEATTPTGNDGTATVTIAALDYAGNTAVVVTGDDALVVDNTPPTISTSAPLDSAYVAHTQVTYTLGETIDSGQVTWTWESGLPDDPPHVQPLTASELTVGSHTGELTSAPTLVQGTAYTLEFLIFDAAGNAESVQTQSVTFDTIPPAVVLTYSDTLAAKGDTVTITARFNEPTGATPQIAFAYQATSVSATVMDTTVDDTIFTYDVIIPTVNDNDGIVTITITADDRAGNGLVADSTANDRTLTIDDTPPGYVLVYSDSLVKQGDPLIITATFTESAASTPGPVISIDYAGSGEPDTASMTMGVADTIWSYTTTAPDSNDGFAIVTIAGTDLAENAMVPISGSTNTLLVDNVPPTITTSAPLDSAYVAHTEVTYTLSETIDSGQVTWTWESGLADDASPHIQPLTTAELAIGVHSGELVNAPTLVQGETYTLEFLALDAAGNADTIQTQSVTYDTMPPAVVLTYSDTLASKGDTVIITATFTEVTLARPQIAFAYQATSVAATVMDTTVDGTIFTYDVIIPTVDGNDGAVTITITASDLAGNALIADSTDNDTSITIDDTPPGYVLAYSDSLVKQGDPLIITATFTEPAKPTPLISLNYADTSIDSVAMTIGVTDTIWTYETTAPDSNDGSVTVTIAGTDLAANAMVPVSGSTNTLEVDNTPPTITPSSPVDGGFVRTTTVTYTLDETVDSGQVTWTRDSGPIDGASPHVQLLATAERAIGSHTGALTNAPVLVQAALYTLQFLVFDAAGNPDTAIVQSVMYDTLVPDITSAELLDSLGTQDIDSTQSTTSLAGRFSGFTDADAGIAMYEYAIGSTKGDTNLVGWTNTASDTTDTTNTTFTATGLSLKLKAWYYLMGRATDRAGNVSDTVFADGVRIISRPAPTIAVVQNSALPAYVQIFITDTLGMANSFTVKADGVIISDSRIDTFTYSYLANHKLLAAGTLDLEVTGHSAAGDSTITDSIAIALAKRDQSWWAQSLDQQFLVQGSVASVQNDLFLTVVDSRNFLSREKAQGSYRLAYSGLEFAVPVKVLMKPSQPDHPLAKGKNVQAVYRLLPGGGWEELPTVDEGHLVVAWSKRAGYFRLGPRTIFVPQTTSLHHNYPNPFNPSTRIVFDLGFQEGPEQRASVIIYNLLGQEVRTLYDGVTQAGRYELLWQGIDQRGAAVASGVYFVRLMTGAGHVEIKKMLLVR